MQSRASARLRRPVDRIKPRLSDEKNHLMVGAWCVPLDSGPSQTLQLPWTRGVNELQQKTDTTYIHVLGCGCLGCLVSTKHASSKTTHLGHSATSDATGSNPPGWRRPLSTPPHPQPCGGTQCCDGALRSGRRHEGSSSPNEKEQNMESTKETRRDERITKTRRDSGVLTSFPAWVFGKDVLEEP